MNLAHEITPAKLRSGDPGALAGLCDRRGGAVYAYCRRAAGDAAAAGLAAEAFAEFRRAIRAPGSLGGGGQAEALLRGVTRRVALPHLRDGLTSGDGSPVATPCEGREREILGYADKTLTPADREIFKIHIGHCRSCAALLQALRDAEPAFKVAPGTPVPFLVAREILGALIRAEPVTKHEDSVRDEALRLLAATGGSPVADPARSALAPPGARAVAEERPFVAVVESSSRAPLPPPTAAPPARAQPTPVQAAPAAPERIQRRERRRLTSLGTAHFGPSHSAKLLRGFIKLAAVLIVAGVGGVLLGLGIAELMGDNTPPTPSVAVATPSTPRASATTPAATAATRTEKVRVAVQSATARLANGTEQRSRLTVRVIVENASARAIRPEQPELLVDDLKVPVASESTSTAGALLSPSVASGATIEGTLSFDVPFASRSELTTARVRLRIAGKFVPVRAALDDHNAGG